MAERKISYDRTFYLGQFKNLKVNHTVDKLPDHIWTNPDAVELISSLLLIAVERDFRRYQLLVKKVGDLSLEDSLAYLSDLRNETYKEIQNLLKNGDVNDG
jgi:hypothetical protein